MLRKIFIFPIKLYQKFISPILPPSCRFYPTCSEYAVQAISKYGVFVGTAKAFWRILRCNPFNKGGFDPLK
ncbi:MAG: membrane protein insertion efficiency factor YidD [Bacteroidota bacterium]|nr:membrane protein insertion efficiency factor YidD [Bacteroidota bacterium]